MHFSACKRILIKKGKSRNDYLNTKIQKNDLCLCTLTLTFHSIDINWINDNCINEQETGCLFMNEYGLLYSFLVILYTYFCAS